MISTSPADRPSVDEVRTYVCMYVTLVVVGGGCDAGAGAAVAFIVAV